MFKGTWSSSTNYNQLDIVYYNGSSYVAKNSVTSGGNNPSINNNWQIVAMKGELSPTLSPEQEASIINAIMSQGVVIDPDYTHTDNNFTNNYLNTIDNINFGTLTVKRNNTTVGTFTSNTNSSVNIEVPTSSTQLSDNNTIQRVEQSETVVTEDGVANVEVKPNQLVIVSGDCQELNLIVTLDMTDMTDMTTWNQPETNIIVTSNDGMLINYNTLRYTAVQLPTDIMSGDMWLITIKGGIITRFSKLNTI